MDTELFIVHDDGHEYDLLSFEGGAPIQNIRFIKKEPVAAGSEELRTVFNGTTNEAVLSMMLHRLRFLYEILPDNYTQQIIERLESCLALCEERTKDRMERGVKGSNKS